MSDNEYLILPKDKVGDLIKGFEGYRVVAPQKSADAVLFLPVEDPSKIVLDYENSHKPPKEAVFPQAQCLMTYAAGEKGFEVQDRTKGTPTVVFGIRDCDARAILYLDSQMIQGDFVDPYYKAQKDVTVLVGLACNKPPYYNCFCTSLGGHPHSDDGLDVQLIDLGDSYLVKTVTEKGSKLLEKASLVKAGQDMVDKAKALEEPAGTAIVRKVDVDGVYKKMEATFTSSYWDDVSDPCIGCGICTFLCPTCFCFDINDTGGPKKGQRLRVWDSCQFPEYTLHASSHNPRSMKAARQRQRFYHKYMYSQDNNGMIGCVGCGRCVNQCPTQIDIIKVINGTKDIQEGSQ